MASPLNASFIKRSFELTVFMVMIQRSVKNQLTADLARPVTRSDSTSTRNSKLAERSFIPDAVATATDSRLSNLVLTLVLGVSPEYKTANCCFIPLAFLQISPLCTSVYTFISCVYTCYYYFYIFICSIYFFNAFLFIRSLILIIYVAILSFINCSHYIYILNFLLALNYYAFFKKISL